MGTLNAFQYEVLAGLATTGEIHGLGLKSHLQDRFGYDNINHGRLYPNLDTLVEYGYIQKGTQDLRTNTYALTDDGHECLCKWAGKLGFRDFTGEKLEVEQ